ncbi:uncharacterized protein MELLADRAFT_71476 [Melampsora larici-populina 98AG31]|uniref:DUF38 domain-containing protein n=1 Tax=Melampsora larici-populina (strain 98AG31 / pathotype 3-4-7) TaxID=747676 RepID=F4RH57_MELLP|nr:uncharacterized protein MELLADRAFT_71476 [Melampsora larici-populina 98AG31]EGG08390.1 hypothetical protein MELLADRAFT_71476 [Melampsora larici-populina 98AG31]
MTPHMAHNLISGNNPFLTKLHIQVNDGSGEAVNVRFDLPSLKHLRVDHYEALDLLVSFENCKSIEVLKYNGDIYEPQWDSMKNLISQHTWPKLSVLDFFYSTFLDGYLHPITAEETEERFKAFNIEVLWQHRQK